MAKFTEDVTLRRGIVSDLIREYPEVTDIDYDLIMNIDLLSLSAFVENKKVEAKMNRAASRIQRNWRRYVLYKFMFQTKIKKTKAATKIQLAWRNYRENSHLMKIQNFEKNKAAVMVQKFLRGFIDTKDKEETLKQIKLYKNLEYFDEIKKKLEQDSYLFIAYYWKKKVERLRKKKARKSKRNVLKGTGLTANRRAPTNTGLQSQNSTAATKRTAGPKITAPNSKRSGFSKMTSLTP